MGRWRRKRRRRRCGRKMRRIIIMIRPESPKNAGNYTNRRKISKNHKKTQQPG